MKRTVFGMATLLLLGTTPCVVNAFTAIAWSESGQRGGSVKNAPTKDAAMSAAIADCKKNGGGSDCQVFKVTDEPGFVALYASCAKTCGVTAVTGRTTQSDARNDGKRECEKHFRNSCQLVSEWQELQGSEVLAESKLGLVTEKHELAQNKKISQTEIRRVIDRHKAQLDNQYKSKSLDKTNVEKIASLIRTGQINMDSSPQDDWSTIMYIRPGTEPIWESIFSTGMYLGCRNKVKQAYAGWQSSFEKKLLDFTKPESIDSMKNAVISVDVGNSFMLLDCSK
jgi:hypothetical protein